MGYEERRVSDYIDSLNADEKPEEHEGSTNSPELVKLFNTVKLIRSLREPTLPEAGYPRKLAQFVKDRLPLKKSGRNKTRFWMTSIAGMAAVLALAIIMNFILPVGSVGIIHAMEEAFQQIEAYHGYVEILQTNEQGEGTIQGKLEVWADKEGHYYTKVLEGPQKGLVTINNGQKKWQVRPNQNEVHVFPAFPDAYRFAFELGKEIQRAKNALSTKSVGEETVAGRASSILEVSPQGGVPYRIWIDKETKLPLKKQSAAHNALEYTITYTQVDFLDNLPNELVTYNVPNGFKEINTNPEQLVNSLDEVEEALGFVPLQPQNLPDRYAQHGIAILPDRELVKVYYTANKNNALVVFMQDKAEAGFKPANTAILGKVGNSVAEIQSPVHESLGVLGGGAPYGGITDISSVRWQQEGFEYAVVGNIDLEELISFTQNLTNKTIELPGIDEQSPQKPQREVEVDLEVEGNEQKSVDAGQSPWKLDPVYVTQVYVSLQISPEGITGEYPISMEDLEITINDGKNAIVEVSGRHTPIRRVYLKRLIREDSTGIWTVVGYDPVSIE